MLSFLLWLSVALLFFVLELASLTLVYFLSFASAALVTAVTSLFLNEPFYQISLFFALSIGAILILRWLFQPHRHKTHATNTDALIGKRGIVTKNIAPAMPGQVNLNGQVWSARAPDNTVILQGTTVEVVRIQGCHLVVKESI